MNYAVPAPDFIRKAWSPEAFYKIPTTFYWLLVVLVLIFSAFQLGFRSEMKAPVMLLGLLGFFAWFKYAGALRFSGIFFLVTAAVLIPLIGWAFMQLQHPELARSPRVEDLANKFYFVIPALLLAGSSRNTLTFWGVAALSALTLPWTVGEGWSEISKALAGHRTGFGRHIITMGMIYAVIALGLLVFFKRIVFRPGFSYLAFFIWLLAFGFSVFAALASQTRAVYLGLFLIGFLALFFLFLYPPWRRKLKASYFLLIAVLLAVVLIWVSQQDFVEQTVDRFSREVSTLHALAGGDIEQVPRDSLGKRFHFWSDALDWIVERPLTGWGYHGSQMLHQEADNYFGDRNFLTIHNDFLDILLSYGLLGLFLFISFFVWLFNGLYRSWSAGVIPSDFFFFFVFFYVFYLFCGIFISSFFYRDSIYLFNIVTSGLVTFIFKFNLSGITRFYKV